MTTSATIAPPELDDLYLRQYPPLPGRGRRTEGQLRATPVCPSARRPWPTHSGIGRLNSILTTPNGLIVIASFSPPDTAQCAPFTLCFMSLVSTCRSRSSRGSASGEAARRDIRNTARPRGSRPPQVPVGARLGERRRHGYRRSGPCGAVQSTRPPNCEPLPLKMLIPGCFL